MFQVSTSCLHDLGWSRVVTAVANQTATDPGRVAAEGLAFIADDGAMDAELARVAALAELIRLGSQLPLTGTHDLGASLARVRRGGVLEADELRAVAFTCRALQRVRRHLRGTAPALDAVADALPDVGVLATELVATFDETGQIRDDASPELGDARRRLASLHQRAKERLERFVTRVDLEDVIQDRYYTQRDDRYVLPIIASFQAQVPGIIHGTSNTGQTVYVEPTEFIEINNQIKMAESEVLRRLYEVLRDRTAWIAADADEIEAGYASLIALDVSQAKARLAVTLNAVVPGFSDDGTIALKNARNPHLLFKGVEVVPNDVLLDDDQAFLVITGPNTGGKTVTLSTVGTFVLMLRAGVPVPADPDSVIARFDGLHALVGDPQDIERDRSTFSGHLMDLQELLAAAHPGALVLLDEIIVGTEPNQGAALAIAVLESLADRGARGFVTTHYERLKTLAYEDTRFGNAKVGVDPDTLAPSYVLSVGEPGSSNPFEIATRLGLDDDIIARARSISGGDEGIARAVSRLESERAAAEKVRLASESALARAEMAERVLNQERTRLRRDAEKEVAALYAEVREEAQRTLDQLRERVRELQSVNDMREVMKRRAEVVEVQERFAPKEAPADVTKHEATTERDAGALPADDLAPGTPVWVRSFERAGEIVDVRDDRVMVAMGAFRTTVSRDDLGKLSGAAKRAAKAQTKAQSKAKVQVVPAAGVARELPVDDTGSVAPFQSDDITIDLRGVRRDEVEDLLIPFLDGAYRERFEAIWIIHGHGTGVVKEEARRLVRESPYVVKWRPGRREEGGDGTTVAWLARE